jgi:hypothetical protein
MSKGKEVVVVSFYPNNIGDNAVGGFDWIYINDDERTKKFIFESITNGYDKGLDYTVVHVTIPSEVFDLKNDFAVTDYLHSIVSHRELKLTPGSNNE